MPRVLPFACYMAFIAIADLLQRLLGEGVDLRWLYPLKITVVAALLLYYRRRYSELALAWPAGRQLLLALGAGVLVLVLWVNLDADWMLIGHGSGYDPRDAQGQVQWVLVALRIVGAAIVVPVMEELFWRSFLMRWIDEPQFLDAPPAHARLRGFVVAVILFGFEHNLWLAGMVAGLVYGWLYVHSGNLRSPILAHGVTNGLLGLWIVFTGNWSYW
nr:CAAX prenyl protease-related protein [Duganella violaceicalia]